MKKTVEIKKPGMKKLDNSLHVKFHTSAYGLVKDADITKLGIPNELMVEWDGNNVIETDISKVSQMSAETRLMQKKDAERDRLLSYIMGTVRNAQLLPDEDTVEAALRLAAVLRPYNGIQSVGFDHETADINGLLADLKKAENTADVTKLGLTPILTQLEAANKEFDALYTKRMTADTGTKLPLAKKIRPETDAIYDRVILTLQWNYLTGTTPIEPGVIATLAENLCKLADRIDADYNRSIAQKKKKPSDPKQPKDPKAPKDPKDPKPKDPKDPKKPEGGGDDIHLPEEPPKKPEDEDKPKQPETGGGTGGSGDDIQIPSEPPKKPDGQ